MLKRAIYIAAFLVGTLGVMTCVSFRRIVPEAAPGVYGAIFEPLHPYVMWTTDARNCVLMVARTLDTLAKFLVVRPLLTVDSLTWIAVPTEKADGTFIYNGASVWGYFSNDTIYISAQRVLAREVVKHEFMHGIVASRGEWNVLHGLPWGICEFL